MSFRQETRAWLDESCPPSIRQPAGPGEGTGGGRRATYPNPEGKVWLDRMAEKGWTAPMWPKEYGGGGLNQEEAQILGEELRAINARPAHTGMGLSMIGPALLEYGTEEQKLEHLPKIIRGDIWWCQGYSEPNSGSDLASLATRAELDGDEWVINGQKIWTSQGHNANWIFVLCRTDPSAVKHAGISFLLCPVDQPGVEVRPIVNASGHHDFNEVFFNDARTVKENVLGGVNNGWAVANTLLAYERGDDATTNGIRYGEEWQRLVEVARSYGKLDDPVMRQRFTAAYTTTQIMKFMGLQTVARSMRGYSQGPESSLNKLLWSEHHHRFTELAMDVIGMDATAPSGRDAATGVGVDDVGSPFSSQAWVTTFIGARPGSIYSGSNEIQRNIIARSLGL